MVIALAALAVIAVSRAIDRQQAARRQVTKIDLAREQAAP